MKIPLGVFLAPPFEAAWLKVHLGFVARALVSSSLLPLPEAG